jgi:hypothetical protein
MAIPYKKIDTYEFVKKVSIGIQKGWLVSMPPPAPLPLWKRLLSFFYTFKEEKQWKHPVSFRVSSGLDAIHVDLLDDIVIRGDDIPGGTNAFELQLDDGTAIMGYDSPLLRHGDTLTIRPTRTRHEA